MKLLKHNVNVARWVEQSYANLTYKQTSEGTSRSRWETGVHEDW